MTSYRFSKWWLLWRNFTSGFGLGQSLASEGQYVSAYQVSSG